jgi:hypothetical protein
MSIRKTGLWTATAAAALMAMPPTAALAFDEVDWNWDKDVQEHVNINVDITNTLVPTGIVEIEKLQTHFGNITATSTIDGVSNTPPVDGNGDGGTVMIDEVFNFDTTTDDSTDPSSVNPVAGTGGSILSASLTDGTLDEGTDNLIFNIAVQGEVQIDPASIDAFDAVDLPSVENAATAVANNQSITSASGVYLHDAQFAAGEVNPTYGGDGPDVGTFAAGADAIAGVDGELNGTNVHTTLAALATLGAATGFLTPAEISANATVYDILNATVDNSATAVTNNMAVEINAANPNDATMIADITQWGYANVTATALLDSCHGGCDNPAVTIDNYANLGALDRPIVSNTATAVGNNLSIKVNAPAVD